MKNQTYGEALGLTYCGKCGINSHPLYRNEEDHIEDRKNWLCLVCWEERDQQDQPTGTRVPDEHGQVTQRRR